MYSHNCLVLNAFKIREKVKSREEKTTDKKPANVGGGNDAKVAYKRSAKTQKIRRFTESQKYRKNSAK